MRVHFGPHSPEWVTPRHGDLSQHGLMPRRLLISTLVALFLAGALVLTLPRFGDTSGWKQTFSPTLAAPTGWYEIGVRRTRLVDAGRTDPWGPGTDRTLMVDVHYPAKAGRTPLAHYAVAAAMTELGSSAWAPVEERRLGLQPDEVNWMFRTHSHEWAPPAGSSFPVLICSAPPGVMRTAYTSVSEELASRGYVVVTVDHPFDAPVVELYPTRRVIQPSDAAVIVPRAAADAARFADLAFVIRRLTDLAPDLSGVMDQRRIGVFGWVGAGTDTPARLADLPGVSAIASVADTHPTASGDDDAGATPLLVISGPRGKAQPARQPRGWRADVAIPGATARALTDDGAVLAQIARRYPRTEPVVRRDVGDAQPLTHRTVRRFLVDFFDIHLRGAVPGTFAAEPGITVELVVP